MNGGVLAGALENHTGGGGGGRQPQYPAAAAYGAAQPQFANANPAYAHGQTSPAAYAHPAGGYGQPTAGYAHGAAAAAPYSNYPTAAPAASPATAYPAATPSPAHPVAAVAMTHTSHATPSPHHAHPGSNSNSSGTPKRQDGGEGGDEGDDEHRRHAFCCSSLDIIKEEYGRGTYIYFKYTTFLFSMSVLFSVFALIGYGMAVTDGLVPPSYANEQSTTWRLFLSAYPHSAKGWWVMTTCIIMLLGVALGPLYLFAQRRMTASWRGAGRTEEIELNDEIVLWDKNGVRINTTAASRRRRKLVSLGVFLLILILQGLFTWFLHVALASASNTILALIISVSINILNALWKVIGKKLTTYERHATWTEYRNWDCGKVFMLKIANVLVLYVVKSLTSKQDDGDPCPLNAMGSQFFFLILTDLTINNIMGVAIPFLMNCVKKRLKNSGGDDSSKSTFDLAEEYVQVLYRQFVVLLGVSVYPTIVVLAAVAYLLEYWLDKARLVYLCKRPEFREEPLSAKLVMAAHVFLAIAAILSFPNGALWIVAGIQLDECAISTAATTI